jgi:hypothetical protein
MPPEQAFAAQSKRVTGLSLLVATHSRMGRAWMVRAGSPTTNETPTQHKPLFLAVGSPISCDGSFGETGGTEYEHTR